MARPSWKIKIALVLLVSSAVLSALHVLIFRDAPTLFFYIVLDIVFVPIQVLLVTIIIEHLLSERERQSVLQKMNMVIGAFFGEAGNRLISQMGSTCVDFPKLEESLAVATHWRRSDFKTASEFIENYECRFGPEEEHLEELKAFLLKKRAFMLGLLQNSNLLEHDRFTDLLWAVCHLTEELEARQDLANLPASDLRHIEGDIQRAFGLLVREWLAYMLHLRKNYPYMYSLSVRMNPFNPDASPVVTG
ncbi:MAG: hypothetical protein WAW37_17600 [Syntrophobacteraceae bacterium]